MGNQENASPLTNNCRKAINFDLHVKSLTTFYSTKSPNNAYDKIRNFMERNGFSHRQGSGYTSNENMTDFDIFDFIEKMNAALLWLKCCINSMDVTDIGETYNVKPLFVDNTKELDKKVTPKNTRQAKKRNRDLEL